MENIIYTIWLQSCIGVENKRLKRIMSYYDNAEHIFRTEEGELRLSGVFTPAEMSRILKRNPDAACRVYEKCLSKGYKILAVSDPAYPRELREIDAPPLVLYVKGEIPPLTSLSVAIVGTREASRVGRQLSFEFGYYLTRNHALVISGGADGIDTYAHRGALQAGGKTVCVLGCGLDARYLMHNAPLRDEIACHGALISEFTPDTPPAGYTFPKRNRIIAALSDCTLVVEAGKDSGSLITAGDAAQQKRMLFAVPGSMDSDRSAGSNKLLAEGAAAAVSYRDILAWYNAGKPLHYRGRDEIDPKKIERIRKKRPDREQNDFVRLRSETDDVQTMAPRAASDKEEMAVTPQQPRSVALQPVPSGDTLQQTVQSSAIQKRKHRVSAEQTANLNEKPPKRTAKQAKINDISLELLTANARSVYDTISETPLDPGTLQARTGLAVEKVLAALTELELFGLAELTGYGQYIRKSAE